MKMGGIGIFAHSNFQAWVLFKLFEAKPEKYRPRDLLKECCTSAIMKLNLDEDEWIKELAELQKASLIDDDPNHVFISEKGIIYVRQNLHTFERVCNDSRVPKDIKYSGDQEIRESLMNKKITVGMILKHGLNDIQSIRTLLEAISQYILEFP